MSDVSINQESHQCPGRWCGGGQVGGRTGTGSRSPCDFQWLSALWPLSRQLEGAFLNVGAIDLGFATAALFCIQPEEVQRQGFAAARALALFGRGGGLGCWLHGLPSDSLNTLASRVSFDTNQ